MVSSEHKLQAIQDAKNAINKEKISHSDFMRVTMGEAMFLVPVSSVLSVVRPVALTPVPMAPDHLIGLANVRGQIFCIVNPCKVLNLMEGLKSKSSETRFLLLRHERIHMGIWVEAVSNLYSIPTVDVPVDSGEKFETGCLQIKDESLPILRISALFD